MQEETEQQIVENYSGIQQKMTGPKKLNQYDISSILFAVNENSGNK